jgi:nucleotide-binding universal stress UspA family protein
MKVLLATDGSQYADGSAQFLRKFHFSEEDEIIILHVINTFPFKGESGTYFAGVQKIKEDIAPLILESTEKILSPLKAKISTAIMEGYPDSTIVDAVKKFNADILVMGSRGLKGIKSILLGSTTRFAALHVPISVLAIKPQQLKDDENIKILLATDGSEHAHETERVLLSLPFPDNIEVTILHTLLSAHADIPEKFAIEMSDRIKEIIAMSRTVEYTELEKVLNESHENLSNKFSPIRILAKVGDPTIEILETAQEIKAHIIAVGSRGLRGLRGMIGSVSRNILYNSECSVLIGKKPSA